VAERTREEAASGADGSRDADDAREEVIRRLRRAGHARRELERADADGRLGALAVEEALGGTPRHTLSHVAREARLDPGFLRKVVRASGRPDPRPRERAFNDEDVELARLVRRFLDAGLPREGILEVARVLGQGMNHTADAVRRMAGDVFLRPGDSELAVALRYSQAAEELTPLVGPLVEYQLRALVRDGIRDQLVTESERREGRLADTTEVGVAFADLVDYTRLGEKLALEDLTRIATRFADLAGAATKHPTRVVKTIGDAVMLVSPELPALFATIVALTESVKAEEEDFPALRVGVAYGAATARAGDWFGATVNLASRVTDIAKPGRVLATEAARQGAGPDFEFKRRRRRSLKGVEGRTQLYSLEGWRGKS
jgi:adenylate cyclase